MLWVRLPEKVYFKKGCAPVALKELRDEYNCKRAFIITDATLFELGMCDSAIKQLEEMGYAFEAQEDVDDDHTLVRFVTSWATPAEAVEQFLKDLASCK